MCTTVSTGKLSQFSLRKEKKIKKIHKLCKEVVCKSLVQSNLSRSAAWCSVCFTLSAAFKRPCAWFFTMHYFVKRGGGKFSLLHSEPVPEKACNGAVVAWCKNHHVCGERGLRGAAFRRSPRSNFSLRLFTWEQVPGLRWPGAMCYGSHRAWLGLLWGAIKVSLKSQRAP